VEIGSGSAVLENSVVVGNVTIPPTIGRRTTFAHRCVVIGATVGDLGEIGNAAKLMPGARLGPKTSLACSSCAAAICRSRRRRPSPSQKYRRRSPWDSCTNTEASCRRSPHRLPCFRRPRSPATSLSVNARHHVAHAAASTCSTKRAYRVYVRVGPHHLVDDDGLGAIERMITTEAPRERNHASEHLINLTTDTQGAHCHDNANAERSSHPRRS
jgi:hypothetical protein